MLRAGRLDQRVTGQRLTRTDDTQGGGAVEWAAIAGLSSVPAHIEPIDREGEEGRQADQAVATQRWRVTLRYSQKTATLTPKDRLAWGSRSLQIDAVRLGGHKLREFVEMATSERTS